MSCSSRHSNLSVVRGDSLAVQVEVLDSAGAPANLHTYTALAQVRRGFANTSEVETQFDCFVAGLGILVMVLDKNVTATMHGYYRWDLQLTDSSGNRTTLFPESWLFVTPEVSSA